MHHDTAVALIAELNFLLRPGWKIQRDSQALRVKPWISDSASHNFKSMLQDEVWRIARFVAYADFVSITRNADGGYVLHSKIRNGGSFDIVFETHGIEN